MKDAGAVSVIALCEKLHSKKHLGQQVRALEVGMLDRNALQIREPGGVVRRIS